MASKKKSAEDLQREIELKTRTQTTTQTSSSSSLSRTLEPTEGQLEVTVPGLLDLTPSSIKDYIPDFQISQFTVSDPLNPPQSLPQVTLEDFNKGMEVYAGATRAVKMYGASFDLAKETLNTVGKQADAIGAGIKASTKIVGAQGAFVDYLSAKEVLDQKITNFGIEKHRTGTLRSAAVHTISEIDESLEQAQKKAEIAQGKTKQLQGKLDELKSLVGNYVDVDSKEVL